MFSRRVVFVPTSSERTRCLKPKEALEHMHPDDNDVFAPGTFEHFLALDPLHDHYTLARFAAKYTLVTSLQSQSEDQLDDISGELSHKFITTTTEQVFQQRTREAIIRYHHVNKKQDAEGWAKRMLALYTPLGQYTDLLKGHSSYAAAWAQQLHDPITKADYETFESKRMYGTDLFELEKEIWADLEQKHLVDACEQVPPEERIDLASEIAARNAFRPQQQHVRNVIPAQRIMDNCKIHAYWDAETRYAAVRSLNPEQRAFFDWYMHGLKTSQERLDVFLTGGAGTGKTYLAKLIIQCAAHYYATCANDPDGASGPHILLMAPTALAAFQIQGTTVHTALRIKPKSRLEWRPLDASTLNSFRTAYQNIQLVITDEVSMESKQMDQFVSLRLSEIVGKPIHYGGLHLLRVGDIFQLAPVQGNWIFHRGNDLHDPLWVQYTMMYELTQIVRQKDCKFASLLNRLREGMHTTDDIRLLQATANNPHVITDPHLYYTNEEKDRHNSQVAAQHPIPSTIFVAQDNVTSDIEAVRCAQILQSVARMHKSDTYGLHTIASLAPGIPVEITTNFSDEDGLAGFGKQDGFANGALGCIHQINQEAQIIWVEFQDVNVGARTRNALESSFPSQIASGWTPVPRITREIQLSDKSPIMISRRQFPLIPATARTVHHTQGSTLTSRYVCDFNTKKGVTIPCALVYVASSRASCQDVLINKGLEAAKFKVDPQAAAEMERLRTLQSLTLPVHHVYCPGKLFYLNVSHAGAQTSTARNIAHLDDVAQMPGISHADIIMLSETGGLQHANYFNNFHVQGFAGGRGMVAMVRKTLTIISCNYNCTQGLEVVDLKISGPSWSHSRILAVYHSPRSNKVQAMTRLMQIAQEDDTPTLLCGDFNLNHIELENLRVKHNMANLGLHCIPLGLTTNKATSIDHIFAPHAWSATTQETYFSYHKALLCSCPSQTSTVHDCALPDAMSVDSGRTDISVGVSVDSFVDCYDSN